ncbi:peptidase domain-containing ABC transporter [Roseateles sp. 22389]|uniref:peptidase domain-containing ABC transporter n=1 Tax=Roseateles sp. 22389 TaxID=3453916 RepID=UPI003F879DE1
MDMTLLGFGGGPRLPVVLQAEASECGLACMAMVLSAHGHHVSLAELRMRFPASLKGTTLETLACIAEATGMVPRALRLELHELAALQTPGVLHWDLQHFVVLREVRGEVLHLHDPAAGAVTLTVAQASPHFTGVAMEFSPGLEFGRKPPAPPVALAQLVGKMRGVARSLFQLFLLALVLEAFALLTPVLTQWITDEAILAGDASLLNVLALSALTVGLISVAIGAMRSWMGLYVTTSFTAQWMGQVMTRLLRLPVAFFERRHLGDVVSRFGAVAPLAETVTRTAVELALDLVMVCGSLAMMLLYSPSLALVPVGTALLYVLVRWSRYASMRLWSASYYAKQAKEQSHFFETVRGVRTIKLFNRENERRSAWMRLWMAATNAHVKMLRLNLWFGSGWSALQTAERVGLLWLGASLVLGHRMSLGMLLAFISFAEQFTSRANLLIDRVAEWKLTAVQTERLADIVLATPEETRPFASEPPADTSVALDRVTFRYGTDEAPVLSQASLRVAPGECVALTGASGAGKTTCLKLMLGMLKPASGAVLVGGRPLDRLSVQGYRELVATVLQDDHLFAGTLLDNICFHDAKPDVEFAMACARVARIDDEVRAMPMGYHTLVGDMGTALSGGQKQRILLARALYKRPRILFLDEATSHLDLENEGAIAEALASLDITRIMIAHRPQTIAIADRVLRLEGGRFVPVRRGEPAATEAAPHLVEVA